MNLSQTCHNLSFKVSREGEEFTLVFGKNFVEHRGHAESVEKCAALSVLFGVMEVAAEKYAESYILRVSPGHRVLIWKGDIEQVKNIVEEVAKHV